MSELRDAFKSKDFIINSNMIRCISSLDINLKEFLLVLYFINVSPFLDTDDIKDKLGLSEDDIVNNFSSLLNKKYIELDVSNSGGVVTEKIKLDPLYDRLAMNNKISDKKNDDIYSLFENEFGRALSPIEFEMINTWLDKGASEDMIKKALKEAVLNGVRNFKYIDKIIYEWLKKGVKNRIKEDNSKEELFDYDWLDDND
jgi:DNA replication protein